MARHRRNRTRISRPLIAVLGATLCVGGGVYVHYHGKKSPVDPADKARMALMAVEASAVPITPPPPAPTTGQPAPATPPATPAPAPLVTKTPSGPSAAPTTAPAAAPHVIAVAPSTRPVAAKAAPAASPSPAAPKLPAVLASAAIPAAAPSAKPLVDAKARIDAGQWLEARAVLNNALAAGHLNAADAAAARHMLADVSQTVFFSKNQIKDDPFQTLYQVQSGDRLARIADKHAVTWELLCRVNGLSDPRKLRAKQWIKIPTGPFHCVITKSAYRLDVYLGSPGEAGSVFVTSFPVGLGKDNSTPTGTWTVAAGSKTHPATYYSPRGEGVIAADDPKNPLGGYWVGLSGVSGNALDKSSYGIHGTIEPETIGKQASMGCIRLRHDDIALLYDLLVEGKSKVVVKE